MGVQINVPRHRKIAMTKTTSGYFTLGNTLGMAHAAITASAAAELQCALTGEGETLELKTYTSARADWVKGYTAGFGCSEKRSENAWAELFRLTGLKKPQTVEAARKAELRKAAKTADKANPLGKAKKAPTAPINGLDVAINAKEARTWVLSATEENLIKWFREGKLAMIEALIHAQVNE
jgi:hypothetical protein